MIKNIEIGVQRIFYVAWMAWICLGAYLYLADELNIPDPWYLPVWIGQFLLFPTVLMFVVRWIYRGFFPKQIKAKN